MHETDQKSRVDPIRSKSVLRKAYQCDFHPSKDAWYSLRDVYGAIDEIYFLIKTQLAVQLS